MGMFVRREQCVLGDPRELLTQLWVQEGYLEYRQVSDNDPARFKFLWGPQTCTETSESEVMEELLRVNQWFSRAFPPPSAEAVREEEEEP